MTIETRDELLAYARNLFRELYRDFPRYFREDLVFSKMHWRGVWCTYLEGICRPLWGLGAVLKAGSFSLQSGSGSQEDICDFYRDLLIAGTDKGSSVRWPVDRVPGQTTTEMAGLCLSLVLAKDQLVDPLTTRQKNNLFEYIYQVGSWMPSTSYKNNHFWFPILINLSLKRLGYRYDQKLITQGLNELDRFYLGDGWYFDGERGEFDYYLAWSLNFYPLLWILLEDQNEPTFKDRRGIYEERVGKFLHAFVRLFDESGSHLVWGRSLSYKFAVVAILGLASHLGLKIEPGLARSLFLANINFFQKNMASGFLAYSPGFLYRADRLTERYISEYSSAWCFKAFLCFLMPQTHPFWTAPSQSPPIMAEENYELDLKVGGLNLKILGEKNYGGVTLFNNCIQLGRENISGLRFNNVNNTYSKFVYNSRAGFGVSAMDMVSFDSMISLQTPERSVQSVRSYFQDRGVHRGVYYSSHVPFANDSSTIIYSAVVPLSRGWHARIHKVRLGTEYFVMEGGFALGYKTDQGQKLIAEDWVCLANEVGTTIIKVMNGQQVQLDVKDIFPQSHIFYSLAKYPIIASPQAWGPGEYFWGACFYYADRCQDPAETVKAAPYIETVPAGFIVHQQSTVMEVLLELLN